jgi:hypothetical protein
MYLTKPNGAFSNSKPHFTILLVLYQERNGKAETLPFFFIFFFIEVRGAASNSAYYGYPELWILRYPAHRYHAVRSVG